MNNPFSGEKRRLFTISLILLILAVITTQASAGSYPSDTITHYAGMVKPQLVSTEFVSPGAWAQYFDEQDILREEFYEDKVDHEWFFGRPPIDNIFVDNFSAHWDGSINIPSSGYWTLYVSVDDGGKLWLDDELVLDGWTSRSTSATFEIQRYLFEGTHSISLQYFEDVNYATIQLAWQEGPKINLPVINDNY